MSVHPPKTAAGFADWSWSTGSIDLTHPLLCLNIRPPETAATIRPEDGMRVPYDLCSVKCSAHLAYKNPHTHSIKYIEQVGTLGGR